MTQDEIIRMAREAGFKLGTSWYGGVSMLERFAALVAAHEREKQVDISALPIIIEAAVKEAVLAEREAILEIVKMIGGEFAVEFAAAIRARGEK